MRYSNYYEIGNGFRIGNPKACAVNDVQRDILLECTKHLTQDEMELFRITSTTRPKDVFGFHRNGHAIDVACDALHLMIKLHEGMIAAAWPGGIAVASLGLPLHCHIDSRHLVDMAPGKKWTACYFLEQLDGGRAVYPVKQNDPATYDRYYAEIRKLYGATK